MKKRCLNPNEDAYPYYGGRGISVCDRWINSFEAFVEDMGERPSDLHEIDRIDPNGDYDPSNCRWIEGEKQALNRRNVRRITANGVTMSIPEWASILGADYKAIHLRIRKGWPLEKAVTEPIRVTKRSTRISF